MIQNDILAVKIFQQNNKNYVICIATAKISFLFKLISAIVNINWFIDYWKYVISEIYFSLIFPV